MSSICGATHGLRSLSRRHGGPWSHYLTSLALEGPSPAPGFSSVSARPTDPRRQETQDSCQPGSLMPPSGPVLRPPGSTDQGTAWPRREDPKPGWQRPQLFPPAPSTGLGRPGFPSACHLDHSGQFPLRPTRIPLQMASSLCPLYQGLGPNPTAEGGAGTAESGEWAGRRGRPGVLGKGLSSAQSPGPVGGGWSHQTRLSGHNYAMSTFLDCESNG